MMRRLPTHDPAAGRNDRHPLVALTCLVAVLGAGLLSAPSRPLADSQAGGGAAPAATGTGEAAAAPVPRPQALLRGSLTWAGSVQDGFLVRWTRPQGDLLVLRRPGEPAVPVAAAAIALPDGMTARIELVSSSPAFYQDQNRPPSRQIVMETGSEITEWTRRGLTLDTDRATAGSSRSAIFAGSPTSAHVPARKGTTTRLVPADSTVYGATGAAAWYPGRLVGLRPVEQEGAQRWQPLRIYPEQYDVEGEQVASVRTLLLAVHFEPMAGIESSPATGNSLSRGPDSLSSGTGSYFATTSATVGDQSISSVPGQPTLKMTVDRDGFYVITAADLATAGFNIATLNVNNLKIFMGTAPAADEGLTLVEVPAILENDNADSAFDPGENLLFYAERATSNFTTFPYRLNNIAWIIEDSTAATRMSLPAAAPTGVPEVSHVATLEPVSQTFGINDLILTTDATNTDGDYYHWVSMGSGGMFATAQFD
ncbi:MAG: hypothetical protein E2P03_03910, partial [Acidobacteria bacterium]